MLKKSLSIIAGGLLVAGMANATELYNQNGTTFSVGGRIDIGYQTTKASDYDSKFSSAEGTYNSSRINFGGTKEINENLKAFGLIEWGFNPAESDKTKYFSNRLGYAGLEHKTMGTITYGKQWSSYYNVAGFTDVYELSGGEANATYDNDTVLSGDFRGTARATSALKYDKKAGPVELSLQYQAKDSTTLASMGISRNYSFGASVVADVATGLKLGIAGNYTKLTDDQVPSLFIDRDFDTTSGIIGLSYTSDLLLVGLTASYHTNLYTGPVSDSTTIGQESYIGLNLKPILVYVGNNFQTTSYKEDNLGNKLDNTTEYNYISTGLKYSFSNALTTTVEYRADLRSKNTIQKSTSTASNVNTITANIVYNF